MSFHDPLEGTEIRDLRNSVSMEIIDVQWRGYRLPFLHSFSTAHSVMTAREGIIVQVMTSQGISGLGEIAPLPAFTGESLADACALLPSLDQLCISVWMPMRPGTLKKLSLSSLNASHTTSSTSSSPWRPTISWECARSARQSPSRLQPTKQCTASRAPASSSRARQLISL